jgi:hypothetical protein
MTIMAKSGQDLPLPDTIIAWQCIGCGRLEGPQNCVGVCQDRKVELVSAWDYAEVRSALDDANERIGALETFVRRLAHVTPRDDEWKGSYLALQRTARELLR